MDEEEEAYAREEEAAEEYAREGEECERERRGFVFHQRVRGERESLRTSCGLRTSCFLL